MRTLNIATERFPVRGTFTIARGAKTHVDVVTATITDGTKQGRGEATAVYYRGETAQSVAAAAAAQSSAIANGATRADLLSLMPAGAARNALDCALWDLEAKQTGTSVREMLGLPPFQPLLTAYTISLDTPEAMATAATKVRARELIKVKLGSADGISADIARMAAVRAAAPDARFIVDANEGWANTDIARTAAALAELGVELIEQPVPAGQDAQLDGLQTEIPLCADESCHDRASLDQIIGRYRFINIKLDKAGGLTEAHALAHAARQRGLGLMTGCMLGTSLAAAPAFHIAVQSEYADLDGPLLIEDREGGLKFQHSDVWPPAASLWG